jgi:hypothetical protein
MQDAVYELPRIPIPRTSVNKGKKRKGQSLVRLDPPHSRSLRKRETSRQQSGMVPTCRRRGRSPPTRRRTLIPPAERSRRTLVLAP